MSYVAVTVVLKDGRRYDDVIVDSEHALHIRSVDGTLFDEAEIDRIVVTRSDLMAAFGAGPLARRGACQRGRDAEEAE